VTCGSLVQIFPAADLQWRVIGVGVQASNVRLKRLSEFGAGQVVDYHGRHCAVRVEFVSKPGESRIEARYSIASRFVPARPGERTSRSQERDQLRGESKPCFRIVVSCETQRLTNSLSFSNRSFARTRHCSVKIIPWWWPIAACCAPCVPTLSDAVADAENNAARDVF